MREVTGNWRVCSVHEVNIFRRLYQLITSTLLSLNLLIVSPAAQMLGATHHETTKETVVGRDYMLPMPKLVIGDVIRRPERVEKETIDALGNFLNDTRKPLVNSLQTAVEEEPAIVDAVAIENVIEEEPAPRYIPSEEEYEMLCRLVEAEVTGYDVWVQKGLTHEEIINSKTRVAQVFLNRVESGKFGVTSLKDAIIQRGATSTRIDGRFWQVSVTDYTIEAVEAALSPYTPDMTRGALYFSSGSGEPYGGGTIFKDEVGHKFAL